MADITRRLGWRHLRGAPTAHVRHHRGEKLLHEGPGLSFWFRALTAAISEVPVDDRELAMTFHARTADFQDVAVQATVTYRVGDPAVAAARLDFSIDPDTGVWRGTPLEQLGTLLTETAQQHALDALTRTPLAQALVDGVAVVRERIAAGLAAEPRLPATGIEVVAVRVMALRPEPEVERALRTPAREQIQQEADRATYERRAVAVERERAIAENELASQIELARREERLVEQRGANARREAEEHAAADSVRAAAEAARTVKLAEAEAARSVQLAEAEAAKSVKLADAEAARTLRLAEAEAARSVKLGEAEAARAVTLARAEAVGAREVGEARAAAQAAWLRVHGEADVATLHALTGARLAENLPRIDSVTVSPDVLTGLLARLGGERE
ncbi:SPFH domain-containing protein [Streptomyces sp. R39]|uniref:SPFH domain-containing protein n=1 Tax=Streptomyces sp. R39 TaxID=3238631 RepID=A0AB39QX69_9ACTN